MEFSFDIRSCKTNIYSINTSIHQFRSSLYQCVEITSCFAPYLWETIIQFLLRAMNVDQDQTAQTVQSDLGYTYFVKISDLNTEGK